MRKKLILISIAGGAFAFAGAFATGWFSEPKAALGSASPNDVSPAEQAAAAEAALSQPETLTAAMSLTDDGVSARAMTEKQLKELIYDVRERITEYDTKLQTLQKEQERFQIARQSLKQDIEALNNLRVELASTIADVKNERDMLLKSRVEIQSEEKTNMLSIAAAYDKMDPARASEILTNMVKGSSPGTTSNDRNTNLDDAVKILHFMQERTKAKVLAEFATSEPALAALLCQKLKHVAGGK